MEVIWKLDRTMPRYLECVWSGVEESEHIEIVGRRGKLSEAVEAAENVRTYGKSLEASECVAGDREDFGRLV